MVMVFYFLLYIYCKNRKREIQTERERESRENASSVLFSFVGKKELKGKKIFSERKGGEREEQKAANVFFLCTEKERR